MVVISNPCKMDLKLNQMVVRTEEVVKINISELSTVIIENTAVSITACLLCELTKRKVKIIFCDEKHNPCSELIGYYGCHDTSEKIRKQIAWNNDIKQAVWTCIVADKIRKQSNNLTRICHPAASLLEKYIDELVPNDETNREGHAAKVYFNAMFGMDYSRGQEIPINAALNYGYAIILATVNREITASGYLTQLGIFHDNVFNQFNFGSDIMEPLRPLIDWHVYNLQLDKFEHEEKIRLLDIVKYMVTIDGCSQYLDNAIKIYCKSIFDALNENDASLISFYTYEL